MNKFIVTTSIYPPSEATQRFAAMKDWTLIVVGDKKTPHDTYISLDCIYISPEQQELLYPKLSDAIGWNCIMRRNIGYIEAYRLGADVVASVDDDNIPYDSWGENLLIGKTLPIDTYSSDADIFDPMQLTNHPELWHRGFPLEHIRESKYITYVGKINKHIDIQADLWDGDPDIDAVCRKITQATGIKLIINQPFTSSQFMPFNSQNTFISRKVLPYYMVIPHIGRMDDIWGGYICQNISGATPVFMPATVYQERNIQAIKKNLLDEVIGYTDTAEFLTNIDIFGTILPIRALEAWTEYRAVYREMM